MVCACVLASQSTKMAAFSWTAEKTDVLIDLYEKSPVIFLLATIFMIGTKIMLHAMLCMQKLCNMLHVTSCMLLVASCMVGFRHLNPTDMCVIFNFDIRISIAY